LSGTAAGNRCVANSNTACGATNSAMTTDCTTIANASTVICDAGTCKATACVSGYCSNGTSCVSTNTNTDVNHCGSCNNKCTKDSVLGALDDTSVSCSDGQCIANQCSGSLSLYNGHCYMRGYQCGASVVDPVYICLSPILHCDDAEGNDGCFFNTDSYGTSGNTKLYRCSDFKWRQLYCLQSKYCDDPQSADPNQCIYLN
jgi:hypothetical protein